MTCFLNTYIKNGVRFSCAVLLVVVVVGDVATFLYGYRYNTPAGDNWFAAQLLCGGVLLVSILLVPILAFFFPIDVTKLSQLWFAVHVTYSDDWARHAVVVLYSLQVQPVVDAFKLTSVAADIEDVDFCWWFAQGFLLAALARCLVGHDTKKDAFNEESEEVNEVVVRDNRIAWETEASLALTHWQDIYPATQTQLAIAPAPQDSPAVTIVETG